jgi:8-oxo-dGTP pyrophosphatase MutT (NUDIX family)
MPITYLVTTECAIEHEGKLLIIKRPEGKHAAGLLAFPGGTVEGPRETDCYDVLRSALKREVFEEVGLTLEDPITYVTSSYFIIADGTHVIHSVFYCKLEKTVINIVPSPHEVPEYYWMTREEILAAPNSPEWHKRYIELL